MNTLRFFTLILFLLLFGLVHAQEETAWTCDDGENDVVLAAQAARDAADYDRAWELAMLGEALCAANPDKYRAARRLRQIRGFPDLLEISDVEVLEINGHDLFLVCRGEGSPTVIFENGFGAGFTESWLDVFPAISSVSHACIYDRYGSGLSQAERGENPLRTTQDEVADFLQLVETAELEAPFVLVGHSIAGLNFILLEEQHPELVLGIVLVDAAHPEQEERFLAAYPDDFIPYGIEEMRNWRFDFTSSFESAQDIHDFGELPLAVITAMRNPQDTKGVWLEMQTDYLSFSSNSRQILAERSDHFIMNTEPHLIIEGVMWVLNQIWAAEAIE